MTYFDGGEAGQAFNSLCYPEYGYERVWVHLNLSNQDRWVGAEGNGKVGLCEAKRGWGEVWIRDGRLDGLGAGNRSGGVGWGWVNGEGWSLSVFRGIIN